MAPRKPKFITFTGVDEHSNNVSDLWLLQERYPIEWGILASPKRSGLEPRYPEIKQMLGILQAGHLNVALHLCGGHADEIMDFGKVPFDLAAVDRVQINHQSPSVAAAARFSFLTRKRCILQTRNAAAFPASYDVDWLFDISGGTGRRPKDWPSHDGRLVGYAGGINPENVLDVIGEIDATGPYWIDMETGVRNSDDRFDFDLVRAVCERVYPDEE